MKKIDLLIFLFIVSTFSVFAQDGIKIVHAPYLQNMGETEVTIVWVANKTSVGWVELAPDDGTHFYSTERPRFYNSRNGIKTEATVHAVLLKGLKPGTRYRYRVYSQEIISHKSHKVIYGDVAATAVYKTEPLSFITNDPKKKDVSFLVVNDIHNDADRMEKLFSHCDFSKTDFVFFNGDMVSFFNSEEEVFSGFMDRASKLFASEIPMYYTRGNHETRGVMAAHFQRYFSPREEYIYYSFRQGDVCFIVLDCGEDKPDSDIEYAGITVYDEYRTEQAAWLEHVLQTEEYKEAVFKVVICHMPPSDGWHGEREIMNKFVPLLNKADIDIMLCGHWHKHVNMKPNDKVHFPVLVNSNDAVLKVNALEGKMDVTVINLEGKEVDRIQLSPKTKF